MQRHTAGSEVLLIEQPAGAVLASGAVRFGDREAVVACHQNLRLTWRGLERQVNAVARGLRGPRLAAGGCVPYPLLRPSPVRLPTSSAVQNGSKR